MWIHFLCCGPGAERFAEIGDSEPGNRVAQSGDDLAETVAVGVGLDDGHEFASGSGETLTDFHI